MKKIISILALLIMALSLSSVALAVPVKGCDGPPELCQQIKDLNTKLAEQKAVDAKNASAAEAAADQAKQDRMAKLVAGAGVLAVALKILLSYLDQAKGMFQGVKGKAALKIVTLVVGFVAFLATNIGMGIPWWQALIVAGGGPGAILVHELYDLVLVLLGKRKDLPPDPNLNNPPVSPGGGSPPPPMAA